MDLDHVIANWDVIAKQKRRIGGGVMFLPHHLIAGFLVLPSPFTSRPSNVLIFRGGTRKLGDFIDATRAEELPSGEWDEVIIRFVLHFCEAE